MLAAHSRCTISSPPEPVVGRNPLLVFDGDCGICTASADWIRSHAPGVVVMSHVEYGIDSLDKVWLIDEMGRHEGADAVATVLRRCDGARWRAVGIVLGAPVVRYVARAVYWFIARHRTRLSRLLGLKACALPSTVD